MQTSRSLFRTTTKHISTTSDRSPPSFSPLAFCRRLPSSKLLLPLAGLRPCISNKTLPRCTRRSYTSHVSQSTPVVFADPHRPDLFYHLLNPPTPLSAIHPAFALSFVATPPPTVDSPQILGWLPAHTTSTDPSDAEPQTQKREASLQDFIGNPKFITFLHDTIRSGLEKGIDTIWKDAALQYQNGWMHIHDQRNPPDQGRIGDPDDIFASVLVEDGVLKSETYQAMPSYRVCTSDGVLQLTPELQEYLRQSLAALK